MPFLSFAQDDSDSTIYFFSPVKETVKPVKGNKFLYERLGKIKKSECFQSIPGCGIFKVFFQFTISEKGRLSEDSIRILELQLN